MKKRSDGIATLDVITKAAAALGDPGRMRLLCYITAGERCVCDLVDLVGLAPATVSRHLSLMREAGLIERMKVGRWHHYRLATSGPAVELARHAAELVKDDPVIRKDTKRIPSRRDPSGTCGGGRAIK